jgi:probable sporulation protein (polysaccharide deacetylase family)
MEPMDDGRKKLLVACAAFLLTSAILAFVQPDGRLMEATAKREAAVVTNGHPITAKRGQTVQTDKADSERTMVDLLAEAERLRIPPVNARVDPVWRAIPGYNGLEVDLDRTLARLLENPQVTEIPYVFREIEPDIKLADLPPEPIYKGNPDKPIVSFMVNVAWGNEHLPDLLRVLREEGAKTTFFLDGSWLKDNRELALAILEDGHELANHGYSHKMMSRLGEAEVLDEIRKTEALLKDLGVNNRLFAPPAGDFDAKTVRLARREGLYTILWTLDTVDWKKPDPASVIRKINSRLEPGALVLMHPTEAAVKSLPAMIRHAREKGLKVGKVSELIDEKRLPPDVESVERSGDF